MRSADSGRAAGVCATTKEKQSGSLSSVAPSQSATANWLLWEPHVQPHTHNWGPPSHMLEGAHTSRCSSAPAFSTQCSGDVWGPTSLLLYLIRDAVSCLVIVIVQICRSRLIAVRTATSSHCLQPLSARVLNECVARQEMSIRNVSSVSFHTAYILIPSLLLIRLRSCINVPQIDCNIISSQCSSRGECEMKRCWHQVVEAGNYDLVCSWYTLLSLWRKLSGQYQSNPPPPPAHWECDS